MRWLSKNIRLVRKSGLLDSDWYAKQYRDVRPSRMRPDEHYLRVGWLLGHDPGPTFSTNGYLASNPDVRDAGLNPLLHWLKHGMKEGRQFLTAQIEAKPQRSNSKSVATRNIQTGAVRPLIFISGEPIDRPGFVYRIERWADTFSRLGEEVIITHRDGASQYLDLIPHAKFVFIWRADWRKDIETIVLAARSAGTPIIFDLDDLLSRPELATSEFIDAIRYDKRDPLTVQAHFNRVAETMAQASYCSATTAELAWQMRLQNPRRPTFVLPNGFSEETYKMSRVAARRKQRESDGLIRLGYASGSRTHQADFRLCAKAVASVLRSRHDCRLVLFRKGSWVTLDLAEYPEFAGLEAQIEWREFVPHHKVPEEVARFDVNLAPLDFGNTFVEAKSELKWFEAAICDVPTIASPTGPFSRAIGESGSGLLAASEEEWHHHLHELVSNKALRQRLAAEAHRRAIWMYGPARRVQIAQAVMMTMQDAHIAAIGFKSYADDATREPTPVEIVDHEILFEHNSGSESDVTVIIPAFNYLRYIEEALDSVRLQSLAEIDLVVLDDRSTDGTHDAVLSWMRMNKARFNRLVLARHTENRGLGHSRNTAFHLSDTLSVMALDADNRLRPNCCEVLKDSLTTGTASFAYGTIRRFGNGGGTISNHPFHPASLISVNGTDAMAMVSKEAWSLVGGYATHRMGWQDYDFWCRLVSQGLHGVHVNQTLADYRVHQESMLSTGTNNSDNKAALVAEMERQFPWLSLYDGRSGHRVPTEPNG
jgi:glycosyltransferase involved in cell wall biosynthesis